MNTKTSDVSRKHKLTDTWNLALDPNCTYQTPSVNFTDSINEPLNNITQKALPLIVAFVNTSIGAFYNVNYLPD